MALAGEQCGAPHPGAAPAGLTVKALTVTCDIMGKVDWELVRAQRASRYIKASGKAGGRARPGVKAEAGKFDRAAYHKEYMRKYMRGYMRKRRGEGKGE